MKLVEFIRLKNNLYNLKLRNSLKKYNNWCKIKPVKSTVISVGIIMSLGDIMTQYIEHKIKSREDKDSQSFKVDTKRLAIMAGYAFLISGPVCGYWYNFVLPVIAPINFKLTKMLVFKQLATKLLIDETIFSIFILSIFILFSTYANTQSWQKSKEKLRKDFLQLYTANLMYWPMINCSIFYYSPIHMQPVVMSVASLFWAAIISYLFNKK